MKQIGGLQYKKQECVSLAYILVALLFAKIMFIWKKCLSLHQHLKKERENHVFILEKKGKSCASSRTHDR